MTREEEIITEFEAAANCHYSNDARSLILSAMAWADNHPKPLWKDASEEPKNRQHCLVYFGGTSYLDVEPALYNKNEKCFVSASYPHPTGIRVVSHGGENGASAEIHTSKRDKIPMSEIRLWCALEDIIPTEE